MADPDNKIPLTVRIMLTERCNLKCKHCYVSAGEKNNEMDFDLVKKIVDDVYDIAGDKGNFSLMGGETLLYSRLVDTVKYIKSKKMRCAVVTNGYMVINDDVVNRLVDAGLDVISISVDGPPEFHDFIRGEKGVHEEVMKSIEIIKRYNIRFVISVPVFKDTVNFLDYLQGLSERFGARLRFSRFLEVGRGRSLEGNMLDKEGYTKLFEFCLKNNHSLQDPFFYMFKTKESKGCECGVNVIYIISDGTVWPCWRMQIPLGNVRNQPLHEILKNPVIGDFQNRDKLKGKCGICKYKYRCGGCRAVPYVLYGDYHGEDPQCPIVDWKLK